MTRPPRADRRRERLKRRLRRLAVALATVLIAVSTLLYFFPLQSAWLKKRVELEFSNVLGRPVSIGDMFVYVFQNRVIVHDMTLQSALPTSSQASSDSSALPPSAAPPFRIKKIVLHMSILSLPWRGLESIALVEVHEPDHLSAAFDASHTFSASGVPGELLEMLLRRRQESIAARPRLPVNVALHNAHLTLDAAPSPVSPFTVRVVEGTLRGNRFGDLSTFVSGYLVYGNTLTPYQADVAYRAANEAIEGRIVLPGQAALETDKIPGLTLPPTHAENLTISLRRQGAAGARLFDIELTATGCSLPWPGRVKPLHDRDVRVRARFMPSPEPGGPVVVDPLTWQSQFGALEGRLTLHPASPTSYSLQLSRVSMGAAALKEALALAGEQYGLQFDDRRTSVSLSLTVEGSLQGGIRHISGQWALSQLTLAHPSLPSLVGLRRVDGQFTRSGLQLNALELEAFHTTLTGRGWLESQDFLPRRLRIEWNTATTLQDTGAFLAVLTPQAPPLELSGRVGTSGWLQLQFPLAGSLESANFDLVIRPENVIYDFPTRSLHGTVIGGELHISPAIMEFRDLRIRQFGSLFQLRGTIAGERYFWERPQSALRIEGTLPLNEFVNLLSRRQPGQAPFVTVFGQMGLEAQVTGRLDAPEGLYWQAQGDVRQAAINFPALPALDSMRQLEGRWIFNGDVVQIQSLRGQWGAIPFSIQGRVAPRQITLNAASELNLQDFSSQIPKLHEEYILYGAAKAQTAITCSIPPDAMTTGPLALAPIDASAPDGPREHTQRIIDDIQRAMRYILVLVNAEARRSLPILQSREIGLQGSLEVRDGVFGHVSMPALISRIDAAMTWENHRLSWTDATAHAGRSPFVSGPSFIDLSGSYPQMNFTGHMEEFDLNQWISDWPRNKPTTSTVHREPRTTTTLFSIDLNAAAQRINIYKYVLGDFSGTMHYEKWRNVPSWLTFDTRSADAFGGQGQAAGRLTFQKGEKPYFDFTVTAERAALDQYFQQVSPEHSGIRGYLSGQCAVRGRPKDSQNLRGEGRFVIEDSEFMRFPVFDSLAAITRVDSFREASFSRIEGAFELRGGRVNFTRIVCDNPLVKIQAIGWVDFDTNLNFDLTLSYFRAIGEALPLLSGPMEQIDALIGRTFRFKVTGTLEEPVVRMAFL